MKLQKPFDSKSVSDLAARIEQLIEDARNKVCRTVNVAEIMTKYEIGRVIIEHVQEGSARATYGLQILQGVSEILTEKIGTGWSVETLKKCRKFYLTYSNEGIGSTLSTESMLSWSHYLVLMRIDSPEERRFYEIECSRQNWSVRQLQRQYESSLYERLALSRNKTEVMKLAREGQTISKPNDILKNPLTLEFLGLSPDSTYSETRLETAIIDKLQMFLLELGKGFLFEARQKRFTFDEENYYVDLVFYNRLLQCYVLIDLKVGRLTHQDLGQMQMYVNYYDRCVKTDFEKPTIGILLCKEKKDALVELTLPKDSNIYAQQYALYLPPKSLLKEKLKEWMEEQV